MLSWNPSHKQINLESPTPWEKLFSYVILRPPRAKSNQQRFENLQLWGFFSVSPTTTDQIRKFIFKEAECSFYLGRGRKIDHFYLQLQWRTFWQNTKCCILLDRREQWQWGRAPGLSPPSTGEGGSSPGLEQQKQNCGLGKKGFGFQWAHFWLLAGWFWTSCFLVCRKGW